MLDSIELELQPVVSHPIWELDISSRAAFALNIDPSLQPQLTRQLFNYGKDVQIFSKFNQIQQFTQYQASAQLRSLFTFWINPELTLGEIHLHSGSVSLTQGLHLPGNTLIGMPSLCIHGDCKPCQIDSENSSSYWLSPDLLPGSLKY